MQAARIYYVAWLMPLYEVQQHKEDDAMRKISGLILIMFVGFWSAAVVAKVVLPLTLAERYARVELLDGLLKIKAPPIAENGAMVTVTIERLLLPTADVYVKDITLFKEYNTDRPVYVFRLGASALPEGLRTRIRLSKTTRIFAFARLSNGQVLVAHQDVKVTIGGCGGGSVASASYGSGSYAAPDAVSVPARTRIPSAGGAHSLTSLQAGVLTAGDIDDNLNFNDFQRYVVRYNQVNRQYGLVSADLAGRVTIRVNDVYGQGVSNARVEISGDLHTQQTVSVYTGSDGVLQFYPGFSGGQIDNRYRIQVYPSRPNAQAYSVQLDLDLLSYDRTFNITLKNDRAVLPTALDLMLVIDTTGSMADELSYLTQEFKSIVAAVRARYPSIDMRFGLVVYRDRGDAYVVRRFDFTSSADDMQEQLQQQYAGGGGDMPEAMDQALDVAISNDWREGNVARAMFLVADAPPHGQGESAVLNAARYAKHKGIRIYSLAASGVNDKAEYLMRIVSAVTQGRYLFLTDDSGIGNKHAEPKVACYVTTRLDHLMIRTIASELSGKRVEPEAGQVVRRSGRYNRGICQA